MGQHECRPGWQRLKYRTISSSTKCTVSVPISAHFPRIDRFDAQRLEIFYVACRQHRSMLDTNSRNVDIGYVNLPSALSQAATCSA